MLCLMCSCVKSEFLFRFEKNSRTIAKKFQMKATANEKLFEISNFKFIAVPLQFIPLHIRARIFAGGKIFAPWKAGHRLTKIIFHLYFLLEQFAIAPQLTLETLCHGLAKCGKSTRLVPRAVEEKFVSVAKLLEKHFRMEHCENYALAFHDILWFFTISCLMLNEITLKKRFHSQERRFHSSMRSCCPGVFSSSSFLQLRSKISNLGLHINTRMKRVRVLTENES